ncbi:hypothetical protein PENANT_c017G06251 [Penicillium antarcticum]|uniref:WSC domain-containing protein n=1 Tax=Penicillium antarcticum TaxID=416450 RepID=A0A1V6Q3Q0_9EURO|nr:uncharacterized protein N7508_005337 [Penicillium antarcticum]KAJ5306322.1 hypothetical protein N7508_005337 [Penicillium antarcticum]OQD83356.1 hypothetical protein PENANT_c017G06251 [Penicillium antarcticum]
MHSSFILAALALALPVYSSSSGYVGCYSDAGSLKNKGPFSYQSVGACEQSCVRDGHNVIGLTRGNMCYCGDAVPSQSAKVDNDKCDLACPGYPADKCGGTDTFTIYQIAKKDAEDSASEASSTTMAPSAATAAGGIIVAATANSAPSGIVTTTSSMNAKVTALASKSANAASTAATSASVSASPTNNAAGTIQVGSSLVGAVIAGMGLLL